MGDLLKRPYQPDDAPALTEFLNVLDRHGGGHGGITSADMHAMISTLVGDPALDTSLVRTPDGDLVAAGVVLSPPRGGFRLDIIGGVHPGWRRRGLGRDLLVAQLDRAEAIHTATDPAMDWEAHVSVMTGDEDALRLFRRFGLTPLRYWFEMAADTAAAVPLAMAEGDRVVSYPAEGDAGLEETLHQAHVEAFRDHWGHQERGMDEWLALSVRSEGFQPELSRLAVDGDELIGYALCYSDADPGRLYVGQVGTRRAWRRRGVAAGLLGQVIAAAKQAGYESVALSVDADSPTGAVGVYERVGFVEEARAVTYARPLPATAVPAIS